MDYITIHLRLTKYCNASCSYCSSNTESRDVISDEDLLESLRYLYDIMLNEQGKDIPNTHITICYIGGEILTIPLKDLKSKVNIVREFFSGCGGFKDGLQSNLIASSEKVRAVFDLFDGRVGTSVEHFTGNRNIGGSPQRYNNVLDGNLSMVKGAGWDVGGVYVVQSNGKHDALRQLKWGEEKSVPLTFRVAFEGNSIQVNKDRDGIRDVFLSLYHNWFMKSKIKVEPFYSFAFQIINNSTVGCLSGCPHENDCFNRSLCLEPNGDVYTCQEMADVGVYKIGNTLSGDKNIDSIRSLANRKISLPFDCLSCEYHDICKGGCMITSFQSSGDLSSKDDNCQTWYSILSTMKEDINENYEEVKGWLSTL